jgi:dihydromethanopterin reductase
VSEVVLIAAVGRRGQLGLGGALPWTDKEDLAWFKAQTLGHVVVVGANTWEKLPPLPGRDVVVMAAPDRQICGEEKSLHLVDPVYIAESVGEVLSRYRSRRIFVAGGARTYAAWMHLVRRTLLTHVAYDGPADAWMPPLWGARG